MWRQIKYVAFGTVLVALAEAGVTYAFNPNADPSLMGLWKLDDGAGTTAVDSSGHNRNGTLNGSPQWVAGKYGGALSFSGSNYVDTGYTENLAAWTVCAWVTSPTAPASAAPSGPVHREANYQLNWNHTDGNFRAAAAVAAGGTWYAASYGPVEANTWYFLVGTYDGQNLKAYRNGVLISTNAGPSGAPTAESNTLKFARHAANAQFFTGTVEDVRVYNRALTLEEIKLTMQGGIKPGLATSPSPKNEATDVPRDTLLSWTPGKFAKTHDVYLGTPPADVNNAGRSSPLLGSQGQDANSYDPPTVLEFGKTYYWRVDEVNAVPTTIFKGALWHFTVEPVSYPIITVTATASSSSKDMGPEKTINGIGLNAQDEHSTIATDMWLSAKGTALPAWIQYAFDKTYKLDKMPVWNSNQALESILGLGAQAVTVEYSTDGAAWKALGDFEFALAPGSTGYTAGTTLSFAGAAAQYVKLTIKSNWGGILPQAGLSEVRFHAIPVLAREPSPAPAATAVDPQVPLSWRAGREAVSHQVYIGTDKQQVIDGTAPVSTVSTPQFEAPVTLGQSYYWKVTEVNEAMTPSTWAGDVWSFTTNDYIVVDDFETYTDDKGSEIFGTWIDGWNDGSSGSQVGYLNAPFAERVLVHSGTQSMPLAYDNNKSPKYSEATRTFSAPQDWSKYGITTLTIRFRGDANNTPAPVYAKINGTKILFNNGAVSTALPVWKQWNIDLVSLGISLKSVKTLTLGVGDGTTGGTGTLFIDDIALYAVAPQPVAPADPTSNGLVLLYALEGNVQDTSGKGNNGTVSGEPVYGTGPNGYGKALKFDGLNDYVNVPIGTLLSSSSNLSVAAWVNFATSSTGSWVRIFDFGSGTTNYMFLTPRQGTTGAMRFAIRTATVTEQLLTAPTTLPSGWHHVAVTMDSATMTMNLYLDGTAAATAATTLLPQDLGNTNQNWLGRSQFTADGFFTGVLDDFRIYNRVLSAAEIRYLAGDR